MKGLVSKLKRASPTILTCIATVGVVATAVTAVRATPKALELIEGEIRVRNKALLNEAMEHGDENCKQIRNLEPLDVVKVAWKPYIPSVIIGLGTIVCIFGANGLNRKQQAALTSAYMLLDNAYKEYVKKAKELYGEDSDRNIRGSIAKDKYEPDAADETPLFFDFFSGRYLNRTMVEVLDAEYRLNRIFAHEDYVTLNEWYKLLGLDPVDFGDVLGWSIGAGENFYNYQWIDFEHELQTMDDGLECYIIHMVNPPTADFMDYC